MPCRVQPKLERDIEKREYMPKLNWKLLTKRRNSSTQGIPPGKEHLAWVTNTVTLVYGERDAVLVDTFLSEQHSEELLDWVAESGKNLTTSYVTHAHGDHFFGLKVLLDRFPNARALATASVKEVEMRICHGFAASSRLRSPVICSRRTL